MYRPGPETPRRPRTPIVPSANTARSVPTRTFAVFSLVGAFSIGRVREALKHTARRQIRPIRYPPAVSATSHRGTLLDGAAVAAKIRERVRADAAAGLAARTSPPSLRVLLVGENPASQAYVASKAKAATEAGIRAETLRLPVDISPEALLAEVARANDDRGRRRHPRAAPAAGRPRLRARARRRRTRSRTSTASIPRTSGSCTRDARASCPARPPASWSCSPPTRSRSRADRAVVLGRSDIVGKPMAALLTARDATVTVCHSKTRDLAAVCREADILVAAIGRPGLRDARVRPRGRRRRGRRHQPPRRRSTTRPRVSCAPSGSAQALVEKGRVLVGDVDFDDVAPGRRLDHARARRRRAADGRDAAQQHNEGATASDPHRK